MSHFMTRFTVRQWLLFSWILCLTLPRVLFEVVERFQDLVAPTSHNPDWLFWPVIVALFAMGGTLLLTGWFIERAMLRPLAAIAQAAHQIAEGNLAVTIPTSDVREIRQVAQAMQVLRDGLAAAVAHEAAIDQERRHFISAVAHDLRTPLFALRGYLSGIHSGVAQTPAQIAHYLTICQTQADTLDQRITTLVDFVRFDYMEQPIALELVGWAPLVQAALERVTPAAQGRAVHLHLTSAATALPILGDVQLLMRMLENLLDNAICYSPAGGAVTLSWHTTPTHLHFNVTDEGPGIPPSDLPHLFDPLFRSESSRSRSTGGMGLGLTIAQRIIHRHGGTLTAANRPEGGACFAGTLPRQLD